MEWLTSARREASAQANRFYQGLIGYNVGVCLYEISDSSAAAVLEEALALLVATEDLRHRAVCETGFGRVLVDRGEFERAVGLLDHAQTTLAGLGVEAEVLDAANAAARAFLSAGKPEAAAARLEPLLNVEGAPLDPRSRLVSLGLLTLARCEARQYVAASESGRQALRIAEAAGDASDVLDARIVLARAESLRGVPAAVQELRELAEEADASWTGPRRVRVMIFLAEAARADSPLEAYELLDRVLAMPREWAVGETAGILARLRADLESGPIRRGPGGEIVIDTERATYPRLQTALDLVERRLVERALEKTGGNASAAARLLGESRYRMFSLQRYLQGKTPRPSRGKSHESKRRARRRQDG